MRTVTFCLTCGGRLHGRAHEAPDCACDARGTIGTTTDAKAAFRIRELRSLLRGPTVVKRGPVVPVPASVETRCCHLHNPLGCCDPNDCGPCCEQCPSCPTLLRRRAACADEHVFTDAPGGGAVCMHCGHHIPATTRGVS